MKLFWSTNKKWSNNIWQHLKDCNLSRNDYTIGCLPDYNYFKEHYMLIAIDLSKQQKLDADPKAMQQTNLTGI